MAMASIKNLRAEIGKEEETARGHTVSVREWFQASPNARTHTELDVAFHGAFLRELIEHYQTVTNTHFEEINHDQQIFVEMTRMRNEMEKLDGGIRRFTGDDLSALTLADINDLEQQLEFSVTKVRARKHQLLNQQLDNLRRKEHILEDQNSFLCRMINENHQAAVGGDVKMVEMAPVLSMLTAPPGAYYGEESSSTALQLTPPLHEDAAAAAAAGYRLQPTQPNLQDPGCSSSSFHAAGAGAGHGHGLHLW
ncbi:hypothetical protein ABZP36_032935 [Zizania latifolia]